jgi:hypothetical protein
MGYDITKIELKIEQIIVKTVIAAHQKLTKSYRKCREHNLSYKQFKKTREYQQDKWIRYANESPDHEQSVCFEVLGFDIILLETGEPILLEVNHQPSLVTDSPLDLIIKKSLIMDTINLLNLRDDDRAVWQKCQEEGIPFRSSQVDDPQKE